jgi:hypothetical protein
MQFYFKLICFIFKKWILKHKFSEIKEFPLYGKLAENLTLIKKLMNKFKSQN